MRKKSANLDRIVGVLEKRISSALRGLPADFHNTFAHVRTGKNLCHSVTLSLIGDAIKSLPDVKFVGFDVRLNKGKGIKFQPDVVGFDDQLEPIILADFESPNSSDARVLHKDISAYTSWASAAHIEASRIPYVVITSLPNAPTEDWECRWTAVGQWNEGHQKSSARIRANPFMYWSSFWRRNVGRQIDDHIAFLNISGGTIHRFELRKPVRAKLPTAG